MPEGLKRRNMVLRAWRCALVTAPGILSYGWSRCLVALKSLIGPTKISTEKVLMVLLSVFCMGYFLADLFIILSRISYPYQLEWLEGASLVQVHRILQGQTLYVKPSVNFVPFIYPPLFFYICAVAARIVGFGFGALRLVSFLSTITCGSILFVAVREKTNSIFAGILAAGSFASAFMLTGQWFDIARSDMLAAALCISAVFMAREKGPNGKYRDDLLGGILFSFSFFAKQYTLSVFLVVVLYYLVFNWRSAVRVVLAFAVTTAILFGIFWLNSGGWIYYYLFEIPAAHIFNFQPGAVISALRSQFSVNFLFVIVAILPAFVTPRRIFKDKAYRYYFVVAAGLVGAAVLGRLNKYSASNVYVPSYLGIALLLGLQMEWLVNFSFQPGSEPRRKYFLIAECLILALQFCLLAPAYLSTSTLPTKQDLAAGNSLVQMIKQYNGDVVMPDEEYLTLYAGKPSFYDEMAMSEISGQGNQYAMPQWPAIDVETRQLIHSPTVSALIVDYYDAMRSDIAGCRKEKIMYPDSKTFIPVAGAQSRPNYIITCH